MSTWGNTDTQASLPKFPKERTVRKVVKLVANSATVSGNTLHFPNTSTLSVGMYVSGNNINVSSAVPGFFSGNVTITSIAGSNVVISNPVTSAVSIGDSFEFDTKINYSTTDDLNYDNNTFLITPSRIANATFGNGAIFDNSVAHAGWNQVKQGLGFVANLKVSNSVSSLSFSGSSTTPANGKLVVIGTSNVSVVMNYRGEGYSSIPTVTAGNSNNATLIFTVTPGGRMGRTQAECLVALSSPKTANANSAMPYFSGL